MRFCCRDRDRDRDLTVTGKHSCSDTLMLCMPGMSQQGPHEEAAPHIPHPDCSFGLSGWDGSSRAAPPGSPGAWPTWASPLTPGSLALSLWAWGDGHKLWGTSFFQRLEALGPRWKGASPHPATNARAAKGRGWKGALSRVGRELFGTESWTMGTSGPFQPGLARRAQAA